MSPIQRQERLAAEYRRMLSVAKESTILQFTTEGEPANRYQIRFQGTSTHADYLNEHDLTLWLGVTFPEQPPEARFLTPIFHPNVPRTGVVVLAQCGITWTADVTLDHLCERLWDLARYAYIDVSAAVNIANSAAMKWFQEQRDMALPVDGRPLRDAWEFRWGEVRERSSPPNKSAHDSDIRFLDGDGSTGR